MTNASRFPLPRLRAPVARARLAVAALAFVPLAAAACSGRLHIEVSASGVYALDQPSIAAAQPLLADCRADELTVLYREAEVPIRVVGADDGRFGPGARIEWVGQMLHGPQSWFDPYSNVNVYQLAASRGPHQRMREIAAPRSAGATALRRRVHLEQENLMIRLSNQEMKPGDEPDVWQWAKLTPVDPQPFTWNFDLPDLAPSAAGGSVDLTVDLRGMSNVLPGDAAKIPDHRVAIAINGHALAPQEWDGRDEERRELAVPLAWLRERNNEIRAEVPQRDAPNGNFVVDVVMFNWFEVGYPARGSVAAEGAFRAAADGAADVLYAGADAPQLYDAAGAHRAATADGPGRWRATVASGSDTFAVVGGKYLAPSRVRAVAADALRAAAPGYDYLIVAHPRLVDAIRPLAQYHREHGLRVAVSDVDAIYDEFNGGIEHPSAIRDLVAWGTQHWRVKPRYLLLVGDASVDIHHDVRKERLNSTAYALRPEMHPDEMLLPGGLSNMPSTSYTRWDPDLPNRNLIPTWQFPSPEGQAASDNGYATLPGGDFHPSIAVGRLPVIEPAEVQAIVAKTLAYLTRPAPGDWRRDITFIATDEVASFKQASDTIAADLGSQGYGIKSLYTTQDASEAQFAHAELKKDLDGGNLLVHFLGHGGAFIWRVGPPADLFTLDDVSALTNAGRYPMVLAMTCFSAPFDNPTEDSIGERFLRESDRGAVAVFAASWTNSPNPSHSKALIGELLKPGVAIGDAIVRAKATITDRTFVEMYNLLGDPALVLARPRAQLKFMRAGGRWNDRVAVEVGEPGFGGEVDVDWVDAAGNALASGHYQARDPQFTLPVPPRAAEVRVYAANLRTGYNAIGALRLVEPPAKTAPAAPKPATGVAPAAKAAAPASAAPATPAAARDAARGAEAARMRPDAIARRGFDPPAAHPAAPAGAARGPRPGATH